MAVRRIIWRWVGTKGLVVHDTILARSIISEIMSLSPVITIGHREVLIDDIIVMCLAATSPVAIHDVGIQRVRKKRCMLRERNDNASLLSKLIAPCRFKGNPILRLAGCVFVKHIQI